jgi:hypothetical protein
LVEHSLHVRKGAKPVKQALRRFSDEKRKTIWEEIARLIAAGFIMEVLHPDWLDNPVLVEKRRTRTSRKSSACVSITLTSTRSARRIRSHYPASIK